MKKTKILQAAGFAGHLRALASAVENDPKRFKQTVDSLRVATGSTATASDDDDDDDEIDWAEVAFIAIMILTL